MTLLEELRTHIGHLVEVNCQLYWLKINCWDGPQERLWVLLDAIDLTSGLNTDGISYTLISSTQRSRRLWSSPAGASFGGDAASCSGRQWPVALQFLVDGEPKWISLTEEDYRIIK
jgi:hypothetical protein